MAAVHANRSLHRPSALIALLLFVAPADLRANTADGYVGLELEQAIERLERQGLKIVYSSDLVRPGMKITVEPVARDPRAVLAEIVREFGLAVVAGPGGTRMLVRARVDPPPDSKARPPPGDDASIALDEIVVNASRYRVSVGPLYPVSELAAGDIALLPEIADDPLRAVARLPGVAHQDFSSKSNIRGGVADETLVRFDGLRLYDAYHLKDFQSLFSTVDPGLISGMSVYTAGFPVTYGDRMGSVIDVTPIVPNEKKLQGQLAASFFNLGGRVGGSFNDDAGHWLASARRGNLDVVLNLADSNLGTPKYSEMYAHTDYRVADGLVLAVNALQFEDDLIVSDLDEEEQATAEYGDKYLWLNLDINRSAMAGGRVQLSRAHLDRDRVGSADLPGVGSGSLTDRRRFTIDALQADGWWILGAASVLEAGAEWRHSSGSYEYEDEAEFELLFLTPGAPSEPSRTRAVSVRPRGDQYGAYVNARLEPTREITAELGLRWDRETLTPTGSDRLSPRAALMWQPNDATRLRVGWGQYFQTQSIDELAVPDGETQFHDAQRAEHFVMSVEHHLTPHVDLRVEAYRKNYERLRPRYEMLLNPLVVLPELKPDRIRIAPDSATAEGVEASLVYDAGPRTAWLSYSASRVEDRVDGEQIHRSWDQPHFVSAGAAHRGPNWEFSVAATWHSGWPTTAVALRTLTPFPLVEVGPRNDERLGSYSRLDARVARKFQFRDSRQQLTVYFEVSNLVNRRNDCCMEYQLEDEEGPIFLDVAAVKSLPLVPSLGVVWEF
jgi:hypothetical protein